jgi:hypothetical protein
VTNVIDRPKVRILSESDLKSGINEIKDVGCVQRWVKLGMPAENVEMEISNVISDRTYHAEYQKMRRRVCNKYHLDERELVRQLLQAMIVS